MSVFNDWTSHPAVVLALPDSTRTDAVAERLTARGWRVLWAATATEARRLACRHRADAVVLPVDGPDESGWLTCAKIRCARPRIRVLLVGERTPAALRFARFVGAAALVPADAGAARLAESVARCAGTVAV
jgi:DNA-binding NarL/FixJ family response regulator